MTVSQAIFQGLLLDQTSALTGEQYIVIGDETALIVDVNYTFYASDIIVGQNSVILNNMGKRLTIKQETKLRSCGTKRWQGVQNTFSSSGAPSNELVIHDSYLSNATKAVHTMNRSGIEIYNSTFSDNEISIDFTYDQNFSVPFIAFADINIFSLHGISGNTFTNGPEGSVGIRAKDFNFLEIGKLGAVKNKFEELDIAIQFNSVKIATVNNCIFKDSKFGIECKVNPAISLPNNHKYYLKVIGTGKDINNPTFENLSRNSIIADDYGVELQDLTVKDNIAIPNDPTIQRRACFDINYTELSGLKKYQNKVNNSLFNGFFRGIVIFDSRINSNLSRVEIKNNKFDGFGVIPMIIASNNLIDSKSCYVENNHFTHDDNTNTPYGGITVSGFNSGKVSNNILTGDLMNSEIFECENMLIQFNTINQQSASNEPFDPPALIDHASFLFQDCKRNTLSCNTFNNCKFATTYLFNSDMSNIRENVFNNCSVGLHINDKAFCGQQSNKDNTWPNSGAVEAKNENLNIFLINSSKISINQPLTSPYWPNPFSPATWIEANNLPTSNSTSCFESDQSGGTGGLSFAQKLVLNNTFPTTSSDLLALKWEVGFDLFENLDSHPDLVFNDTLSSAFLATNQNSTIGILYNLLKSSRSATNTFTNSNQELADAALYYSSLNSILSSLNAVTFSQIYEQNFANVLKIVLEARISGEISASQNALLLEIAGQCRTSGGIGVKYANGLTRTNFLPQHNNCTGERSHFQINSDEEMAVLFPNPVESGEVVVKLRNLIENPKIALIDSYGQEITCERLQRLNELDWSVVLPNLPSGLYVLQISSGTKGFLCSKKLIIK